MILILNVCMKGLVRCVDSVKVAIVQCLDLHSVRYVLMHGWLLLVIIIAVAGIILVIIIFVLNLTITSGTINGIIFYTNIII